MRRVASSGRQNFIVFLKLYISFVINIKCKRLHCDSHLCLTCWIHLRPVLYLTIPLLRNIINFLSDSLSKSFCRMRLRDSKFKNFLNLSFDILYPVHVVVDLYLHNFVFIWKHRSSKLHSTISVCYISLT